MQAKILKECGFYEALLGMGLSYGVTSFDENGVSPSIDEGRLHNIAMKLAFHDNSESKFLRFIQVWIDITAPRFWWQEMATYKVGLEMQSESTMHTIFRRGLTQDDFEAPIPEMLLESLNQKIQFKESIVSIKNYLPEGFLQRRIIVTNYATLQRILHQRAAHKLPQWRNFCECIQREAQHTEFLFKEGQSGN